MKFDTIKRLYTREDIHNFVLGVWKTDLFRKLHDEWVNPPMYDRVGEIPHTFVSKIVDDFAKLPRFTFEMSDPHLEWAHFSTWWGGIPARNYENPYIHDLYWIHEMAHAGRMVYVPDMTFENFLRKMTDNELEASVISEVQVYFEIPKLRKLSFPHEIYADRFLNDADFVNRYKADPHLGFEELKVRRRDTMIDPNPKNVSDFWIHRFYTQNAAWGACWAHSYNKVETTMSHVVNNIFGNRIQRETGVSFTNEQVRKYTLNHLIDRFLHENTDKGLPFHREAEAFAGVYWANRGHYDDAMKAQ